MTVPSLIADHQIDRIDLLKVDVEGGEREIFGDVSTWIGAVDEIVIELHDRFVPGCTEAFEEATRAFEDRFVRGEDTFVRRR